MDHAPKSVTLPQQTIYEMINETINKEPHTLKWPKEAKKQLSYLLLMPLTHLQALTIPNVVKSGNEMFYPLTILVSMIWIWAYTYCIVWFTYVVTVAFSLHFSILPMLLYPLGISIRDRKKFDDFRKTLKIFKEDLND